MIDYDDIESWGPFLDEVLYPHVPLSVRRAVAAGDPEFIEDARDLLLRQTDRDKIIDATLAWLGSSHIAAYHGSRLTEEELASVRMNGLVPLIAEARHTRLVRALSPHYRWHDVAHNLNTVIQMHGESGKAGSREGQVHLTLSRAGLTKGFNHYLTYGSEFDQCVARTLLGMDGIHLLACDAQARVICVAVPGEAALEAAHPFSKPDDLRARGDLPNIAGEFLAVWCYRLAHNDFQSRALRADCGMIFRSIVPSNWIVGIDPWIP